jgi:multidrug efflux pump
MLDKCAICPLSRDLPQPGSDVRKKVGDILANPPQGVFFNDEFGDTFGNICVLPGEGFDYATADCRAY